MVVICFIFFMVLIRLALNYFEEIIDFLGLRNWAEKKEKELAKRYKEKGGFDVL